MTRAGDTLTGKDSQGRKALRRVVESMDGDFVVEVYRREIVLYPKGTRAKRLRIVLPWGGLYLRALAAQIDAEKREKRRAKGKGRR